jgi:PAS domain S-box-containing protein
MNIDEMSREELIAEVERLNGLVETLSSRDFTKLQDGILNNVQGAVMATDTDMKIIYWNRYSEIMHQYRAEEVLGKNIIDVRVPPENREKAKAVTASMVKNGYLEGEFETIRKDGSRFPSYIKSTAIRDRAGKVIGFVGIHVDITDRKKAEAEIKKLTSDLETKAAEIQDKYETACRMLKQETAGRRRSEEMLRESEANLRAILNSSLESIFLVDRTGKVIEINEASAKNIGVAREAIIGRHVSEFGPPEVHEQNWKYFEKVIETGKAERFEGLNRGRMFEYSFYPVVSEDGSVSAIAAYIIDVTEKRAFEEKLRMSEQQYRTLAESSNEMIFMIDCEGVIRYVNNFAAKSYGARPEDLIGKKHDDIFPPDIARRHNAQIAKVFETGKPVYTYDRVERMKNPDRTIWIDAMLVPVTDETGKPVSVLGISRDITDRKKLNDEIIRSSKLESLGTLAGGIAHDFNNVLMGIIGNITMAGKHASGDDKLQILLRRAEKIAYKARSLTEQLITFARGGAPVKKTVSLSELIRETAQFAMTGANAGCELSLAEDLWPAEVDEGQIVQVFTNILINSRQAMPEGGKVVIGASNILIEPENAAMAPAGKYVSVSFSDSGCGISPEDISRIFDPFFSRKDDGKGLGLATAYSIIKRHSGAISVESDGRGTTFTVLLPASDNLPAPEKTCGGGAPEKISCIEFEGIRILVMDDDESVLFPICDMLAYMGCSVRSAVNGEQACEEYERAFGRGRPFDLLILDLVVKGGMGGVETLQKIRRIDKDARAVVSSGYSNDPVMANYKDYGFCGALIKPYCQQQVIEILQEHGRKVTA